MEDVADRMESKGEELLVNLGISPETLVSSSFNDITSTWAWWQSSALGFTASPVQRELNFHLFPLHLLDPLDSYPFVKMTSIDFSHGRRERHFPKAGWIKIDCIATRERMLLACWSGLAVQRTPEDDKNKWWHLEAGARSHIKFE